MPATDADLIDLLDILQDLSHIIVKPEGEGRTRLYETLSRKIETFRTAVRQRMNERKEII